MVQRLSKLAIAILKSTYKCTLQVAVNKLSPEKPTSTVYLTLVGGGAFGNNPEWIKEALVDALNTFKNYPLKVKLVYFNDYSDLFSTVNISKIIQGAYTNKYLKYKNKYLKLKNKLL